jgi:site-specific DNA-methyltransferase (adenine-specific)
LTRERAPQDCDWRVVHGECLKVLVEMPDNSVDAVVTHTPYGIGFSGHEWDQPGFPDRRKGNPTSGRFGRSPAIVAGRYDRTREGNRAFQA